MPASLYCTLHAGISNIDIRRLRNHFKRATLTRPVASELLPAAAIDLSMTTLAWINLTQVCIPAPACTSKKWSTQGPSSA